MHTALRIAAGIIAAYAFVSIALILIHVYI